MIHESEIKKYKGNLKDLATDIGDLRYDALAEFLSQLSEKIAKDGAKDRSRERVQLATYLEECAANLEKSAKDIDKAWRICAPYI